MIAGLALASLFALLALRKGEDNKPRFLEIPICALLSVACLGCLVASASTSSIAETLLMASEMNWQTLPPGQVAIRQIFEVTLISGGVGLSSLMVAIALSGFLRNFLLGLFTSFAAFVAFNGFYVTATLPLTLVGLGP